MWVSTESNGDRILEDGRAADTRVQYAHVAADTLTLLLHGTRAACCIEPTLASAQQKVTSTSFPSLKFPPTTLASPTAEPTTGSGESPPSSLASFTQHGKGEKNLAGGAASQVQFPCPTVIPACPTPGPRQVDRDFCAAGVGGGPDTVKLHCAVVPTSAMWTDERSAGVALAECGMGWNVPRDDSGATGSRPPTE